MQIEPTDLARLRSYMSRGEVILFTGAGFSVGAKDRAGKSIPSSYELKRELWDLYYRGEPFDEACSLGDLYGAALSRKRSDLEHLIRTRLTVDPDSIPAYYNSFFSVPWMRCYTLNIDDLESAVARHIGTERRQPVSISARDARLPSVSGASVNGGGLEVVHLNGIVSDDIDRLTFSETQYAIRIGAQEPWYARCVVEITARPVIFIGTVLNEVLLWHHMELRRKRENAGRDLRPTSILVTPNLSRPRSEILRDLRINWIKGTAEEFATEILPQLRSEISQGFAYIRAKGEGHTSPNVPVVSDLSAEHPRLETEYLLGGEPQWADILEGRAAERCHDRELLTIAEEILEGKRLSTAVALTGTAGTGKSTALMSLALKLTSMSVPVLWVDKNSDAAPSRIRAQIRNAHQKVVLAIDDADMYGKELAHLVSDLVPASKDLLLVFAMRSNKMDATMALLQGTPRLTVYEHVVPPLNDEDIDGLIAILDKNKRLGLLTGASPETRRKAFAELAGRQLLVAMIKATSGEDLEKRAQTQFTELEGAQRFVYLLVAVASALRYSVSKDEVLLAGGEPYNESLAALERLEAHHLISSQPEGIAYRCRHRVIADLVFDKARELGELSESLASLAWALATKADVPLDRTSKNGRFLVRLINHDYLINTIGVEMARDLYAKLQPLLGSDYHYWLQRGSLEVEVGDLRRAENFLGSAKSLGAGDLRVRTEYAYMLMKKACEAPRELRAEEYLNEGMSELEDIIESSGRQSEHPFHVYGSQGILWARRAIVQSEAKRKFLTRLLDIVNEGIRLHPTTDNLRVLAESLKREILLTVTTAS